MRRLASQRAVGVRPLRAWSIAAAIVAVITITELSADTARIASAANFSDVVTQLAADFEMNTDHKLEASVGSTGQLYAQIIRGAPYEVLLAADQTRPSRLEAEGYAVPGSRFTYAIGRLALWSADPCRVAENGEVTLREGAFRHLAIANPKLAPYGMAAEQTLRALGVYESLSARLVLGANIGQAHALVATGNAELGLVSLSSLASPHSRIAGSRWTVPRHLHDPIRQDAVLLKRGAGNRAAETFFAFLQSPAARRTILEYGYAVD